jgi:hypothetical protein
MFIPHLTLVSLMWVCLLADWHTRTALYVASTCYLVWIVQRRLFLMEDERRTYLLMVALRGQASTLDHFHFIDTGDEIILQLVTEPAPDEH